MADVVDVDLARPPLRGRLLRLLATEEAVSLELETFLSADIASAVEIWFGEEDLGLFPTAADLRRMIDRDICEIDEVLSKACNLILHHPKTLALESCWRGVYWLTGALGADGQTRVRILDCRWGELARDLERAAEFDQSALFEMVYNQEFGMPGGIPFSLLIGLYEVQHRATRVHPTDDISVLRRLSAVAASAFAPFVLGARPEMLGVEQFGDLDRRSTLASTFRSVDYNRFNAFRGFNDSRFIGLVCPRVLLRSPYRGRSLGDCGFDFHEIIEDAALDQVWGVGSLALAQVCLRAFNDYRWLAAIRGTVPDTLAGGVITELATPDFETDAPETILKFPVEVNFTEGLERDLTDAGIICIRRCKDTEFLVINNLPSVNKPKTNYTKDIAKANDQLGTMINYMLCVSRFAHYIKVIGREWIGSYISPSECEQRLNRWLNDYCTVGDDMSYELRARYPLEAARVQVREVVGQPGSFECAMWLKPHLQLDQAISEFQLVTVIQGVERQL